MNQFVRVSIVSHGTAHDHSRCDADMGRRRFLPPCVLPARICCRQMRPTLPRLRYALAATEPVASVYGAVAFPVFGVVIALTLFVSEVFLRRVWVRWVLFVVFASIPVYAFQALFLVPVS